MYEVLFKVLANRLRLVIGNVISETQSIFIKRRQIFNGIVMVNEIVDDAKKNKRS